MLLWTHPSRSFGPLRSLVGPSRSLDDTLDDHLVSSRKEATRPRATSAPADRALELALAGPPLSHAASRLLRFLSSPRRPRKGEAAPGPASLTRGAARRVASGAAAPTSCHSAEEDCRSEPTKEELLLCRLQLLPPLSRLLPPLCLL